MRKRFCPSLEPLEGRLVPSTLTIDNTAGTLAFSGDTGSSLILNGSTGSGGQYSFKTGAGDTVALAGDVAGWTGDGTQIVTGPSSGYSSITINSPNAGYAVAIGATAFYKLDWLKADITVRAGSTGQTLTVYDMGGTLSQEGSSGILVGANTIAGLAGVRGGQTITFDAGLASLAVWGSAFTTVPETYTIDAPSVPLNLQCAAGADTVNILALDHAMTVLAGGSGNKTFNIGVDGSDTIHAALTVNGGQGINQYNVVPSTTDVITLKDQNTSHLSTINYLTQSGEAASVVGSTIHDANGVVEDVDFAGFGASNITIR